MASLANGRKKQITWRILENLLYYTNDELISIDHLQRDLAGMVSGKCHNYEYQKNQVHEVWYKTKARNC